MKLFQVRIYKQFMGGVLAGQSTEDVRSYPLASHDLVMKALDIRCRCHQIMRGPIPYRIIRIMEIN